MKIKYDNRTGFTLLELLLYVAMAAVLLLATSMILLLLLRARVQHTVSAEVDQQGMQVMQLVTQTIRNAAAINTPSRGTSGGTLSLDVFDSAKDPTVVTLASGAIVLTEGASIAVPLTAAPVTVSGLTFSNLSASGTPGTVRLQFTISYTNPSGLSEYNYTKTFYGSSTIR